MANDPRDPRNDPQVGDVFMTKLSKRAQHKWRVYERRHKFVALLRTDGLNVPLSLSRFRIWALSKEVEAHGE